MDVEFQRRVFKYYTSDGLRGVLSQNFGSLVSRIPAFSILLALS
jgi:hypothetical protein